MAPQTRSASTSLTTPHLSSSPGVPTIAIIGTGWAGHTLIQNLTPLLPSHRIILLSPVRTMALTPLLASAACGIFDFRIAEEPIRRITLMSEKGKETGVVKYQVFCDSVDFEAKTVRCRPAVALKLGGEKQETTGEFDVQYDKLVICPGSTGTDFGTPGVSENTMSIRTVTDAQVLRRRILDVLELASLPSTSEEMRKKLLHVVIVGGGPTGCELAAEIDELVSQHLSKIYPDISSEFQISVYEVADKMLGSFGEKLGEYAMEKFRRRGVEVKTGMKITGFEEGVMKVKREEGGEVERIGFGVAIWSVGNKAVPLVESIEGIRKEKGRLGTDAFLRLLKSSDDKNESDTGEVIEDVFALGDCADITSPKQSLPMTAEAAVQKAKWLGNYLSAGEKGVAFEYKQKDVVAYIGREDGVIRGTKRDWTGTAAWAAWRGGSLEWTRGWRRRVMVVVYWALNKLDGREIARR